MVKYPICFYTREVTYSGRPAAAPGEKLPACYYFVIVCTFGFKINVELVAVNHIVF
jgi:hypothetical protein